MPALYLFVTFSACHCPAFLWTAHLCSMLCILLPAAHAIYGEHAMPSCSAIFLSLSHHSLLLLILLAFSLLLNSMDYYADIMLFHFHISAHIVQKSSLTTHCMP